MRPILRCSSPNNNLHRVSLAFYLTFSLCLPSCMARVGKVLVVLSVNYALAKAIGGAVPCCSGYLTLQRKCASHERVARGLCICKFSHWIRTPGKLYARVNSLQY